MRPRLKVATFSIDRRNFLKRSLLATAAATVADPRGLSALPATADAATADPPDAPGIIDTNINLFDWPFRALKYRRTDALVAKLKKHRVIEAWAGSFEALLAKDMNGVNARLAAECREHGRDFLIPFGSVNLAWPDWQEDVRRCHEVHQMPGIRIYPGYQPFDLDHPGMESLLKTVAERGLILQVVFGMEDPRVHHPILNVGAVNLGPLAKILEGTPSTKIQLLHFAGAPQSEAFAPFIAKPNTFIDISRLEGNGAIGRMVGAVAGLPSARAPINRIAFGSHAPYFPIETAILKVIESPLDARQLAAVLHGNARGLLPKR